MFKKIFFLLFTSISVSCFSQELTATVNTVNSVIPGQDFTVEITVNKPSSSGFMKYFQELPAGYSATGIESRGGDFKFADNGAKIVWVSPPMDNQYIISYKITTPENANGTIAVGGKFSYIVNNERKVFEVVPQNVSVKPAGSVSVIPKEEPKKEEPKITPKETPPVVETPKEKTPEPKKEAVPEIITTPVKVPVTASTIIPGRTYKVQIGAFAAKPKIDGVPEVSTVVLDNGVTKYFSGNFKTYEEAAKRKKEMIEKGFQGAFVVSFENGKIVK
jgi:hypothetical protein